MLRGPAGRRAYALSNGLAQPLSPVEQFVLAGGRADPADVARDLFGDVLADSLDDLFGGPGQDGRP